MVVMTNSVPYNRLWRRTAEIMQSPSSLFKEPRRPRSLLGCLGLLDEA